MPAGDKSESQGLSGKDRVIRVFISSTFRDMQVERDYLVKFIFPQLRKLCESRGVTWGEVDLRWGVTDEQAAEGKVLPICLEEIKRCRPYFIGLLGERYGWIPDALPDALLEREPWLKEHLHGKTSVTELEILHGVLRNPEMAGHAYFYFRDPAYVKSIPEKDRKDFAAENVNDTEKLSHLKENIRRSGFPVRENYPDPNTLGELVLADLTAVIDKLFPEGSQPDPLDREAMDHEAYAQSRERVYIVRQEYFDRLDTHAAANDTQPLVILGESGSGKSALLANWVSRYRQAHPDILVLQHYIGATPYSADWAAMLRRLMGEFKRRLGLQQDMPDQPDALRSAFPNWLYMAAAKGRVVLVLDALDQLEDRDGAPDLVWLPPVLPENVRLVVSTLPARPLDEIQKRNWPTLKVELLSADERRKLIAEYLAQHAKNLSPARVERIAAAPPSANPLYLRVLLDELRLVRTHEELEECISDYLKAESPHALYEKVIARWEQDYEGDSDLVGDTLSLLWAARRGLTETELLQALGKDNEPLPRAKWSPLFLAMYDALISRGGLLTFAHDFLHTAVENACLLTEQNQQRAHLRLADYFERQLASPRRTDELPWQLAEAKKWEQLQALLVDRAFLNENWERHQFEVKAYWIRIESNSDFNIVKACHDQIEHPENEPDRTFLRNLGILLRDLGHSEAALRLSSNLVKFFRVVGDNSSLADELQLLAFVSKSRGDTDGAEALFEESVQICRGLGNPNRLQEALSNHAVVLFSQRDFEGAQAALKEAEGICRQSGNIKGLAPILSRRGLIQRMRGDPADASSLFKEAAQICRTLNDSRGLAETLILHGGVLYDLGDYDGAATLLRESERICRQIGDLNMLPSSIEKHAGILQTKGDLDGAMARYQEVERIFRQLGNVKSLPNNLHAQAELLLNKGAYLDQAMAIYEEAAQISRRSNYPMQLQVTLSKQAQILIARGELHAAMALLKEAEQICKRSGDMANLQAKLQEQAVIFYAWGDTAGVMALLKESERICRELNILNALQTVLCNQARILEARREFEGALALHREIEGICRQSGNLAGLGVALNDQAGDLTALGDLHNAMALFKEVEQICRKLSRIEGIAAAQMNQAVVLMKKGNARQGLPLAEEAHRLLAAHGYISSAKAIETPLNTLRQAAQAASSTPGASGCVSRELQASDFRDLAATALKRGLWEAAETYLEKLLQQGEPVETVAPDLITALLNAHETLAPATVTRIESLLAQLSSASHVTLATRLRQHHASKLTPPKKPRWKVW